MYPHHQPMPAPTPQSSRRTVPNTPSSFATTPASSMGAHRGLCAYVGHRVVELLSERQLVDHALSVLPQLRSVAARPHFHGPHWTTRRKKHDVDLFEFDPANHGTPLGGAGRRSVIDTQPPVRAPLVSASASAISLATTASASAVSAASSVNPADHYDSHQDVPHTPLPRSSTLPHGFQTKYKLPNPGIDMAYAAVAQCELEGSVTEVAEALFNDDAIDFEASMKALWAGKLKRGDLLLARTIHQDISTPSYASASLDDSWAAVGEPGKLAIKTATVGAGLRLTHRQMGAEKLCYTSFTRVAPSGDEAFHVVKTLPLDVHDQIACGKTHVALRDASVDHIAVGYYLSANDSVLGGKRTRVVVCAYASSAVTVSSSSRASQLHWHPRMDANGGRARANTIGPMGQDGVNADVRRVVMLLAKATRDFQQIVRQRRLGHQRFVYFPTDRNSCRALEQSCIVCVKRFGLFRKDHYCQLCGHLVCRQCSKKHKVEALAGKVRENRICFPCVARVDGSTFHDEQLWRGLVRPLVLDADVISPEGHDPILENAGDDVDTPMGTQHSLYQGFYSKRSEPHRDGGNAGVRKTGRMSPLELATDELLSPCPPRYDQEEGDQALAFDRSFGSSVGPTSPVQREIQVAQDLFSPHPQRRASALEALSRVVLDARQSIESHNDRNSLRTPTGATPRRSSAFTATTPRRTMDPVVVDKYIDDQRTAVKSSKPLPTFGVRFPRAKSTAIHPQASVTPVKDSVVHHKQQHAHDLHKRVSGRSSSALKIDTAAFDSICEAVVQRLGYAMVFLVARQRTGKPQVLGMHLAGAMRDRLPRHVDLASYCPSGIATGANLPVVVVDPAHDERFRQFPLVDDARIRFFAEFAVPGLDALSAKTISSASLCVMDTGYRGQRLGKQERNTVKTLCSVASDLISSIAH